MIVLSQLYRYPVKSAAVEPLVEARLDALGLEGDRRWMVVEAANGRFLTQRLLPQMGRIEARWVVPGQSLRLRAPGREDLLVAMPGADDNLRGVTIWRESLRVPDAGDAAAAWLSDVLERPCRLVAMPDTRARQVDTAYARPGEQVHFADGFPLLLINQASVDDLSSRVGRTLEVLRFRPNLLVSGADAYAEDGWNRLRIGEVLFRVVAPCSRCILTTLDPQSGARDPAREPLATLLKYRNVDGEALFGQNLVAENRGEIHSGMPVELLD
ncbi:MAG: putative protein YcbX [Stenotrophomonas maltophilia]|nr:MAG: putative protein YcbX [Stenotrophomonas maltophilia]